MTSTMTRKPFAAVLVDDNDEVADEVADEVLQQRQKQQQRQKHAKKCQRRRRRSSARFLKLSQPHNDDDDDDDELQDHDNPEDAGPEKEQLGELYKRAIRMNAENRINAGNSWNLKLIENMDKLTSHDNGETINFTKASCTLDASVKIYSYRVDDVHLTSYKVLANLNRNDAIPITDKKSGPTGPSSKATHLQNPHQDPSQNHTHDDHEDGQFHDASAGRKPNDTLETNLGTYYYHYSF
jgi:Condensin complex subunit 2